MADAPLESVQSASFAVEQEGRSEQTQRTVCQNLCEDTLKNSVKTKSGGPQLDIANAVQRIELLEKSLQDDGLKHSVKTLITELQKADKNTLNTPAKMASFVQKVFAQSDSQSIGLGQSQQDKVQLSTAAIQSKLTRPTQQVLPIDSMARSQKQHKKSFWSRLFWDRL